MSRPRTLSTPLALAVRSVPVHVACSRLEVSRAAWFRSQSCGDPLPVGWAGLLEDHGLDMDHVPGTLHWLEGIAVARAWRPDGW